MSGANAEIKRTQYCEKVAQINILTNKIVTWCLKSVIKESKQTIHYICFQFSRYYVQIPLLIW